jgi:hypothetical protein
MKIHGGVEMKLQYSWHWNLMEVSGQLYHPATLSSRKESRYPLGRRLGGPQSRSGHYKEGKNLAEPGIESQGSSL